MNHVTICAKVLIFTELFNITLHSFFILICVSSLFLHTYIHISYRLLGHLNQALIF